MNDYTIACKEVTKLFQDAKSTLQILKGVNLQVTHGEQIAIMGRSGSGKTTLLQLLGGLDAPTSGEVYINGHDLRKLPETKLRLIRNKNIGFIYQLHHLLPEFSALENIAMPMLIGEYDPKHAIKEATKLINEIGLSHRKDHRPNALSGGERQRVAIARALAMQPNCVLADEPTGNLDSENAQHALEIMRNMSRNRGTAFIVVTHDLSLAHSMDKAYQLVDGVLRLE